MNALQQLPPWAAVLVAGLALMSAVLAFSGSLGLLRFRAFYQRAHAPTLGTTAGVACMVGAVVLCFSLLQDGLAVRALLIGVLLLVTAPIGLLLVVRAALARDHLAGTPGIPPWDDDLEE